MPLPTALLPGAFLSSFLSLSAYGNKVRRGWYLVNDLTNEKEEGRGEKGRGEEGRRGEERREEGRRREERREEGRGEEGWSKESYLY